jgi:hypothetical protein
MIVTFSLIKEVLSPLSKSRLSMTSALNPSAISADLLGSDAISLTFYFVFLQSPPEKVK